ncbi:cAMP-independent regulatory protein [Cryptococcus neoformans Bt85]|nr:cAMP-independent regulatory protein [Cryptococcus neoformans var. grubii Bt85]
MSAPPSPPCNLDPPFRGYIETTFDALLVFEAARRGMIPRVTRRLIERERAMVQSGAVFVFDEHESGIKRWTDGLVWSPSRILNNFLVYRETDKRSANAKNSGSPTTQTSPQNSSSALSKSVGSSRSDAQSDISSNNVGSDSTTGIIDPPPLGQGALARPRSASEGGGSIDRLKERQLVGSLTNSYKFKENGLVKKTMSVSVNGFAQHVVSYYAIDDVISGKLRTPSSIPELASLEISPEYLHKQNFRFPPQVEVGPDGIPRYRGEPEEPQSPHTPASNYSFQTFHQQQQQPPSTTNEYYEVPSYNAGSIPAHQQMHRMESPRNRPVTVPMPIPLPSPAHSIQGSSYMGPGSAGSGFYESPSVNGMHYAPPLVRQSSSSSVTSSTSAIRPGSSANRRYAPYGGGPANGGNRGSTGSMQYQHGHQRRQSGSDSQDSPYPIDGNNPASYDVKPTIAPYYTGPPSGGSGTFTIYPPENASIEAPMTSPTYAPAGYGPWQPMHPSQNTRLMPARHDYAAGPPSIALGPPPPGHGHMHEAPSSAGSGSSDGQQGQSQDQGQGQHQPSQAHAPPQLIHPQHQQQQQHRAWASQSHVPHAPGWELSGTPSPSYGMPSAIHQGHEDWRQNAGAIA